MTVATSSVARLRAREGQLSQRLERERGLHPSVDAAFEMVERDGEVGGGIIAGALAYRLFIWRKQGTYGALGIAAAMLVGLFLISRLVVFAAVFNATLWERRGAA